MYRPVSLYIALRYIRGHSTERFGRLVSWLSTLGITLGVMALIIILSVMNGFENNLQQSILRLMPEAILTTPQGELDPTKINAPLATQLRGVQQVVPLNLANVVLQSTQGIEMGVMLGITTTQYEPLAQYIVGARQQDLLAGQYNVILGQQLANNLNVQPGEQIRVIVPSVNQLTPFGSIPSQRLFTVIGVFAANSEVDGYQLLVNQQDAARILHYQPNHITGWRLFLTQPLNVEQLSQQSLPSGTEWKDWRISKGELFQAVQLEKRMMGLLLGLIIAVAAFNIITSLSLLVMDKQGEIAILQTQGLTRRNIMSLFMIQGAGAGILGAVAGAVMGIVIAQHINQLIPGMASILGGDSLPVLIQPLQVIGIVLFAILLALLATLYPAWRAASTQPAEALRYE